MIFVPLLNLLKRISDIQKYPGELGHAFELLSFIHKSEFASDAKANPVQ